MIVLGVLLTGATAWCLGRIFLRLESHILSFLTGSALLSTIVFLLCTVHLARKGVFLSIFLLAAAALYKNRPAAIHFPRTSLLALPLVPYALIYVFYALTPDTSPDGITYHLGNVLRWWSDRGFTRFTGSMYANLSQGVEMLFLFAFTFGRHTAATLVHYLYLLTLPCLLIAYGRRFDLPAPFAAAAVLIFASPVVGVTGTSSYNDLAAACAVFASFYFLQLWDADPSDHLLAGAGLMAGFSYAVKYTTGIAILYAFAFVLWRLWRTNKLHVRPLAILAGSTAICVLPWMIKNWIWLRNPVSPFFNAWFPNPNIHIWFEKDYLREMSHFAEIKSLSQLPLLWSMKGVHVGGLFGPWLLLTPLALLALKNSQGRRLLLAALLFALPIASNNSTRLLLPCVVFAAPALCIALRNTPGALTTIVVLHALVSWPSIVPYYADPLAWRLPSRIDWPAALHRESDDHYLARTNEGYVRARVVEQLTPPGAKIYALDDLAQGHTTRPIWHFYESAEGETLFWTLYTAFDPGRGPNWEWTFRFAEQPLRAVRIVQTSRKNERWTVNEMRVYRAKDEIPRQPQWRIAAKPNNFEVAYAFDNSEVTSWSTWQAIEPGMYLEQQFPTPTAIDRIGIIGPEAQWGVQLHAEGLTTDGRWITLAGAADRTNRTPPKGLRFAAAEEFKAHGFRYIVANCKEGPGKDMWRNAKFWNATLLQEVGTACIFRLD